MADPMWANAVGGAPMYDARELRRDASGLYWKGGTPDNFGARSGILRSQNAPEAAIAGMTVHHT